MPNNLNKPESRNKDSVPEKLRRFLFGDDIFISYSRVDSTYALALANKLQASPHNLSCFLDQWGTPPGEKLPDELIATIKKCSTMVLIGSKNAAESENVGLEVRKFLETNRPLIPITFVADEIITNIPEDFNKQNLTGTLEQSSWYPQIAGIAKTTEVLSALRTRTPSENIISRIVNAVEFRSRNKRLRKTFYTTLGVLVLLFALAGVLYNQVTDARNRAQNAADTATKLAEDKTAEANRASMLANAEADRARSETNRANEQTNLANSKQKEAEKAAGIAAAATRRAENETKKAELAAIRTQAAEQRETIAKGNALKQQNIALSREFASRSVASAEEKVNTALSLALTSYDAAQPPTLEAKQSLLAGLTASPHLRAFITPSGYSESTFETAVSGDGAFIAATENLNKIVLWRNNAPPPIKPQILLENSPVNVWTVAVSRDGKKIAAGFADKTVRFWDTATGTESETVIKYEQEVRAVKFNFTGDSLAVGLADGSIYIWKADSDSGQFLGRHPADPRSIKYIERFEFSPDGKTLASYSTNSKLLIWNLTKQSDAPAVLDFINVSALTFSPDSRLLAFNSGSRIQFWDREARSFVTGFSSDENLPFFIDLGEPRRRSDDPEESALALAFSADGKSFLAVSNGTRLNRWNFLEIYPDENNLVRIGQVEDAVDIVMKGHDGFNKAAFYNDSRMFISNSSQGFITAWNVEPPPALNPVSVELPDSTSDTVFNPVTGDLIAVGSYGLAVIKGDQKTIKSTTGANRVIISRDGKRMIVGSYNQYTLLDAASYEMLNTFSFSSNIDEKDPVTFSPDLELAIAKNGDEEFHIWELSESAGKPPIKRGRIAGTAPFVFGGNGLVVNKASDRLYLWDIRDTKNPRLAAQPAETDDPNSLTIGADNKLLASITEQGLVSLWSIDENKKNLQKIKSLGYMPVSDLRLPSGTSLAFSPNGSVLASTGDYSKLISLWDVGTGRPLGNIPTHRYSIEKFSFSPDSRRLAAPMGKDILIWNIDPESWKSLARNLIGF